MKKKHFLKKFFLASISLAGILSVNASAEISDKPNKIKKSSSHIKKIQPQELTSNSPETQIKELGIVSLKLERFPFNSKSVTERVDQLETDFAKLVEVYFNESIKWENEAKNMQQNLQAALYDKFRKDLTRVFERFINNGEKTSRSDEIKDFTEIKDDMLELLGSKEFDDLNVEKKATATTIAFAADFFITYLSIMLNLGPDLSPQERNLVNNWQKFVFEYFIGKNSKKSINRHGIWRFTGKYYSHKLVNIDRQFREILSKYFNRDQMSMREIKEAAEANPNPIVQSILDTFYVFRERMITARNLIDTEPAEENILNDQVPIVSQNGQNQITPENNPDQIIEENEKNQIILESDPSYDHDYAADNLRTFSEFLMNQNNNYMFGGDNHMFDESNQMFNQNNYMFDENNQMFNQNNYMFDEDNDMVDENNQNQMSF